METVAGFFCLWLVHLVLSQMGPGNALILKKTPTDGVCLKPLAQISTLTICHWWSRGSALKRLLSLINLKGSHIAFHVYESYTRTTWLFLGDIIYFKSVGLLTLFGPLLKLFSLPSAIWARNKHINKYNSILLI